MKPRFNKLSHTLWESKYHIVFSPKYRYRIFNNHKIRDYTHQAIYQLLGQKDQVTVNELNVRPDHIHLLVEVPPKYAISQLLGFLKGKLAISLFRNFPQFGKTFWGRKLWARGYCVSTVGINETQIRQYVRWQEKKEKKLEQQQRLFK